MSILQRRKCHLPFFLGGAGGSGRCLRPGKGVGVMADSGGGGSGGSVRVAAEGVTGG